MSNVSIRAIESILDNYTQEIESLNIPDLLTFRQQQSDPYPIPKSPYINQFKLQQIKQSLNNLDLELDKHKHNKSYHDLHKRLNHLYISILDEKIYVNSKLISQFESQNAPPPTPPSSTPPIPDPAQQQSDNVPPVVPQEDLSSLRKRLLAGGKTTSLLDSEGQNNNDMAAKVNEYHESIQQDIMNELSELTTSLKTSAVKFSAKILGEDLSLLEQTNENMLKNANLFKIIDRNLTHYLENKTGGKIGLVFLIKIAIGLAVVFMFMMIFIKVIPLI